MPADLLGKVQRGALERAGLDPQRGPSDRWLRVSGEPAVVQYCPHCLVVSGLPRGSGGHDRRFPVRLQSSDVHGCGRDRIGMEDVDMACGVEMMSVIPLGSNMAGGVPWARAICSTTSPRVSFRARR